MTTVKGVTETVLYDEQAVIDRYGIIPAQMVDFKALKGDPSDNIPGVAGIGEKTAAKLIQRFGTIENLLEHVDEVEENRAREALLAGAGQAVLSKRLATIVTDVPVGVTVLDLKTRTPDYDELREFFRKLEFRSLISRLPTPEADHEAPETPRVELGACRTIESEDQLRSLISSVKEADSVAVRTHTTQGKPSESQLLGISFSLGTGKTAYVRIASCGSTICEPGTLALDTEDEPLGVEISSLRDILESPEVLKFGHDLKNDFEALKLRNITLSVLSFDTMVGAYLLNSARSSYALRDVAFEQLALELPQIDSKSKELQPSEEFLSCAEAEAIWRLVPVLRDKLGRDNLLDLESKIELPLVEVLAEVELRGVAIDTDYLRNLSYHLNDLLRELEREIYQLAGHEFNIGSPKQLQTVLFEEKQIPSGKKTKTGYSTDADTLETLALIHPIVAKILQWREWTKLKSTYADALPKLINPRTGRIHTSLNQAVTTTGRLSSSEPNLQNIPIRTEVGREIRKAFVATNGNLLLSADYSQIELRILAHVTRDPELVRAFQAGEDIHIHTASTLFSVPEAEVTSDMRRSAKTVNFAVTYGMSDFGLAKELGIGAREAHEFIQRYFERFPGVREYTEKTISQARDLGYVRTLLGRRRYIPEIHSGNRNYRMFAERAAVNMPIQGTAADIMKLAMIDVHRALKREGFLTQMVLQVHDELVFEAPPNELKDACGLVRKLMETAFPLSVPLVADVKSGRNWAESEPVGTETAV